MSKKTTWSFMVTGVLVGVITIGACRTKSDAATRIIDIIQVTEEPTVVEVEVTVEASPVTVEVTRIVVETEVVEVTPEPPAQAPKELVVCLTEEPESLYPYSRARLSTATNHILQAIYENMVTSLSFDYQARGIEKLPSLADGDAQIKDVTVEDGDTVYDINEAVVILKEGVRVRTSDGEIVRFDGTSLPMPQMSVQFKLRPLVWSDGVPVTADDSVFSYELAADSQTPVPKTVIERTASYEALDERTVEWVAVPGYKDLTYFTNIWTPYPRHSWGAKSAADLLSAAESGQTPLSHGPFVVEEWVSGEYIRLVRNTNYYLADEGLPILDAVTFTFLPSKDQLLAQLLSGQCDVGTHEDIGPSDGAFLSEAEEGGLLVPHFQVGTVFEHIDFGINPVESYTTIRPDWFEDVRVRQAFVMCTDRQQMIDDFLFGQSQIVHSYVPDIHPLYPDDLTTWPYDPVAANALLDEAGFLDTDEDGLRNHPVTGEPFQVSLLSALGSSTAERIALIFQENLSRCGVQVDLEFLGGDAYFADGPAGPLFGRQFDLGAFPWLISIEPNCSLYLSTRIPGLENGWNRNYNNETGFSNAEFDAACETALASLPGQPAYVDAHQTALRIWAEKVPVIPLFLRLKVAATNPAVRGFVLDPTQNSELWNLYAISLEP